MRSEGDNSPRLVGHQKDQAVIRSLKFSAIQLLTSPKRAEGLEMELTYHAYVTKPPQNSNSMRFREVPGWQTHPD